jgi:hypothetical protein
MAVMVGKSVGESWPGEAELAQGWHEPSGAVRHPRLWSPAFPDPFVHSTVNLYILRLLVCLDKQKSSHLLRFGIVLVRTSKLPSFIYLVQSAA